VVRDLLSGGKRLERCAAGVLTRSECDLLVQRPGTGGRRNPAWTADDLPLLDEATFLINGRTASYGHIVVDEAQDLSPMQFRMIARRSPTGSLTILGDLAQATGAWSYQSWDEILHHLPTVAPTRREELTLGYRAPGQVLDLASRLLPVAAPTVTPTRSIRRGQDGPRIHRVEPGELFSAGVREAFRLAGAGHLVGLVVATEQFSSVLAHAGDHDAVGTLDQDGITRSVTVVAAPDVKGLEFDAVVVVEPEAIAGVELRGLRLLYVAMTRPIRHLSVVHAQPLPGPLVAGQLGQPAPYPVGESLDHQ
jgi:DNA helicase IV